MLSDDIIKIAEKLSDQDIWEKAFQGDKSILNDPRISKLRDKSGDTPLHYLAQKKVKEIIKFYRL